MKVEEFLANLCQRFTDYFYKSFGEESNSQSGNLPLPVDAQSNWNVVLTMSKPCKLVLKNSDPANDLEITWNKAMLSGFVMEAGDILTLDDVEGTLYARCYTPALDSIINFLAIALKDNKG